jgi:6-phosphogluconolactonase (cycloisomerase 2 family)
MKVHNASQHFLIIVYHLISSFKIDRDTGKLTHLSFCRSGGKNPVFLSIDTTGNYLYVANEGNDSIIVLQINPETDLLTYTGRTIETESPVCILFAP